MKKELTVRHEVFYMFVGVVYRNAHQVLTFYMYLYFSDYKDYYTDTTVKFVLSMTEDKLAEAEQSGLHKKFKLESSINTSNMVSMVNLVPRSCSSTTLLHVVDES